MPVRTPRVWAACHASDIAAKRSAACSRRVESSRTSPRARSAYGSRYVPGFSSKGASRSSVSRLPSAAQADQPHRAGTPVERPKCAARRNRPVPAQSPSTGEAGRLRRRLPLPAQPLGCRRRRTLAGHDRRRARDTRQLRHPTELGRTDKRLRLAECGDRRRLDARDYVSGRLRVAARPAKPQAPSEQLTDMVQQIGGLVARRAADPCLAPTTVAAIRSPRIATPQFTET